jgi:hypothetical protein
VAGEIVDHRSERWTFDHLAPATRPVQGPLEVWLGWRGPRPPACRNSWCAVVDLQT